MTTLSKPRIDNYTIEVVTAEMLYQPEIIKYIASVAYEENELYGRKFGLTHFDLVGYVTRGRMTIAMKNGIPVGMMMARLSTSVFDPQTVLLIQDLLFVKPGTRAAKYLIEDFIDFGKANANHIITMIAEKTNIKPRSLEKLGFKKLETLYRLET